MKSFVDNTQARRAREAAFGTDNCKRRRLATLRSSAGSRRNSGGPETSSTAGTVGWPSPRWRQRRLCSPLKALGCSRLEVLSQAREAHASRSLCWGESRGGEICRPRARHSAKGRRRPSGRQVPKSGRGGMIMSHQASSMRTFTIGIRFNGRISSREPIPIASPISGRCHGRSMLSRRANGPNLRER